MSTILAVEDDQDLRELLYFVLEGRGYTVMTASNGREALVCIRECMPDLILLDMRMPIMSGSEFAAAYHKLYGPSSRAPVIVMSAAEHVSRRCQEVGATDFLAKPFSTSELVETVTRYLPSPQPSAEA